jgi:hypothetical protein
MDRQIYFTDFTSWLALVVATATARCSQMNLEIGRERRVSGPKIFAAALSLPCSRGLISQWSTLQLEESDEGMLAAGSTSIMIIFATCFT